ncbi:MAG: hypothetical protein JNK50_15660 [Bacteroidia bacterium]|nr:hypothetical protein [Bacteroidia bacterium]
MNVSTNYRGHFVRRIDIHMKSLSKRYIIISYVIGIILIIILSWSNFITKETKEELITHGKVCKATIIKTANRKRGLDIQYEYFVAGKTYTSWDKVYNDSSQTGDEIEIVYLPNEPSISRLKSEIE